MQCSACGEELHPAWESLGAHPNCLQFDDPWDTDPLAVRLKADLIEIIRWADRNSPRSTQVEIGPSEIGDPCERRVGYRIAEVPPVNTETDPWAAIVGTSIHSWLDEAITSWCRHTGDSSWRTETKVSLDELVQGTSDAYNRDLACVIDHKGAGTEVLRKIRHHGPPPGYVVQVQCYGLGYERLGLPVKKVALAFYPRSGWLRDMFVWTTDYDRDVAERALARLHRIATQIISLDILNQSHRWEDLDAVPSNGCGFCPWYDPDRDLERGASDKGCPGR